MVVVRVLFVCTGNAFRSPVAEALLRKYEPEIEVDSAGINLVVPIAESVRNYLAREKAEQYLKRSPERLNEKNLENYDLIIAMEQSHMDVVLSKCPECVDKIVVWNIIDQIGFRETEKRLMYKQIKKKVEELAETL